MIHGNKDLTIRLEYAQISVEALNRMGCNVDFKTYAMGHTLCAEEISDISKWLEARLEQ
jgi:phospholipase/carboxylesterase